jgi:hypothetical protein
MPEILFRTILRVRDIANIEEPQASFPVRSIDVGSAIARVALVLTRPSLNGHIVNVDPTSKGSFPTYFCFANLDYSR